MVQGNLQRIETAVGIADLHLLESQTVNKHNKDYIHRAHTYRDLVLAMIEKDGLNYQFQARSKEGQAQQFLVLSPTATDPHSIPVVANWVD